MGVTIHYRLRSTVPEAGQAREVVGRLRSCALELPLESVGEILELTGDDCDFQRSDEDCPYHWLLIQAQRLLADPRQPAGRYPVVPLHVIAFSCRPGPGCEEAHFGLCRYPEVLEVDRQDHRAGRRIETHLQHWSWASFCKTGYARRRQYGGAGNFDRCHWAIVDLLQHAQTLGILREVHDEAGYWASRQVLAKVLGLAPASV